MPGNLEVHSLSNVSIVACILDSRFPKSRIHARLALHTINLMFVVSFVQFPDIYALDTTHHRRYPDGAVSTLQKSTSTSTHQYTISHRCVYSEKNCPLTTSRVVVFSPLLHEKRARHHTLFTGTTAKTVCQAHYSRGYGATTLRDFREIDPTSRAVALLWKQYTPELCGTVSYLHSCEVSVKCGPRCRPFPSVSTR